MACRPTTWDAVGSGSFSVDASTAKTLDSTTASGDNITTVQDTNKKRVWRVWITASGAIRFTFDGTAPTSSTWHQLASGASLDLDVSPRKFKFISESGTVTVYASYFGE